MVVAPTDSFKIFTTGGCFFLSTHFLVVLASAPGIAVSGAVEGVATGVAGSGLSPTHQVSRFGYRVLVFILNASA